VARTATSAWDILPGVLRLPSRAFDILPDGRFVGLLTRSAIDAADAAGQSARAIRHVANWFTELNRLAPTK
jgi:hypothetical protein